MDGKTLAGWHPVGDGKWTVEDGAFVGRANNEKLYGLLVSDKTFRDFTVRFKFKCLSGDSGFYIRTIIKEPEQANGLQVQVGRVKSGVGGIYESYGRAWVSKPSDELEKSYTRDDQWNEMVIDAHGGNVVVHGQRHQERRVEGRPQPARRPLRTADARGLRDARAVQGHRDQVGITILRWHRELVARKWDYSQRRQKLGRPPISKETIELLLRMARENPTWGYDRIQGALANLGHKISDSTVANIP